MSSALFRLIVIVLTVNIVTVLGSSLRLAGGTRYKGRLEVYIAGQWGTVCDDGWDSNDARVACRQLGFGGPKQTLISSFPGNSFLSILLDDVQCTGFESRLSSCSHTSKSNHNCNHNEDVAIECYPTGSGSISDVTCDVGWTSFKGSCYKYYSSAASWYQARSSCQSDGADLVVVRNSADNYFLYSTLARRNDVWIGLTDLAEEDTFKWVESGTISDYDNFASGQPSQYYGNRDCVRISRYYNGGWVDNLCSSQYAYVCQINLDDESPRLDECPEEITVGTEQGKKYAEVSWTEPIASDNVEIHTETKSHSPGDRFQLVDGKPTVYTVRYWVQDYRANEAECLFNVTIIDNEPPELQCPQKTSNYYKTNYGFIHASTDDGSPNGTITWTPAVARDNSGISPIITNFPNKPGEVYPMKLFPPYTTTITATDVSGNSRKCVLHFAVVDTEGPVLSCPTYTNNMISSVSTSSWSVFTDRASRSARLYWSPANATDNSGTVVSVTSNYNSGDVFQASNVSYQITYTAIDGDNNVGNCTFYITVEDVENPSVECPSHLHSKSPFLTWNITLSDNVGVFQWMANDSRVVPSNSTLNHTDITLEQNGTFSVGTSFIVYVVRDMSGNMEECLLAITIEDLERPSIICPSNFSNYYDYVFGFHRLFADYGRSYAIVTWPSPEVNDDSQEPITWESFPYKSGDKFPLRRFPPYTVQFTATDQSGNNRSCYVYFTVIDIEPPIMNCPTNITNYHDTYFGIVRAATDPGSSTSTVTWNYPTVSDNSQGDVNVKSSYQPGESFAPKFYPPYEVEFTAEDNSGNKNTCKLYFLVTDNNPPECQCPSFVKADIQTGMTSSLVRWQIVVSDVEPISLIKVNNSAVIPSRLEPFKRKVNFTASALLPIGITIIEYAFEDSSNNVEFCTFQVEVPEYTSTATLPFTGTINEQTVKSDVSTAPGSSTIPNGIYTDFYDTNGVTTPSLSSRISLLASLPVSTSLSLSRSTSLSSSTLLSSSSSLSLSSSPLTTPLPYSSLSSSSLLKSLLSSSPSSLSSALSSFSLITTQTPSTLLSSESVTDEVVNTLHHTKTVTEDDDVKHKTLINDQQNTAYQTIGQQLTNFRRSTDTQPIEFTDRQSRNQHTTEKPFISRQYTFYSDEVSANQPTADSNTINHFSTDQQHSTKQHSIDQTIYSPSQNTLVSKLSTEETVSSQRFTSSVDHVVTKWKDENSNHTLYELNSNASNELSISDNLYRMTEDSIDKFTTASSPNFATSRIAVDAKLRNTNINGIESVTKVIICLSIFGGLLFFISVIIIMKKKILDKSDASLQYSDANVFDSDRTSIDICDLELLNKESMVARTGYGLSNCAYISGVKDSKL